MVDKNKEEQELKDIFENRRFFRMEDGTKYYIETPTADEIRQADWHYSKTYNEAFLAGVTTLAQMQEELEKRKIIGRHYDEKREQLQNAMISKIAELEAAKTPEDKLRLANEVEDARTALFRHNQKASSPSSQTCEQLAEDARVEHLTSNMIIDEKANRIWKGYDDYKMTDKPGLALRARYEVMLYLQGLDSDFLEKTPESLARKEAEEIMSKPQIEASVNEGDEKEVVKDKAPKKKRSK